ncbi:hypothetical protein RZO07_01480 [Pseudomonas protegens]|uniref:GapS4b family protein n=1 Tax=Pseudomonas protegens TaxID=380021 RepID=UPI0029373031|nr:hypothetical protein [Pseudomonas protegens]WOE79923.1 hypothetical protein RZO07_01480 [Pseudomonas protegens]
MTEHNQNFEAFLPHGEVLRPFLNQPFISKGDLKNLLRKRGVFTSSSEKEYSIPALTTNLITPSELETLRLNYSNKEENPKVVSQTIEWNSPESLIESLPEDIDLNQIIDLDFKNYKVTGSPYFTTNGKNLNQVILEFELERLDQSTSWADHTKSFKGSIEIVKDPDSRELIITNTHTAPETKEVTSKITNHLVAYFKSQGHTPKLAEITRILFCNFDNSKRFDYLLALTKLLKTTCLNFEEIVDAGISPDPKSSLHPKIEWVKEKIKNLNLSGSKLDETLFFEDDIRDCLVLHRLDCNFRFSTSGHDGNCIMSFSFPDYALRKSTDAELEVKIKTISFEDTKNPHEKSKIKLTILKEVEHAKISKFKELKI